MARKPQNIYQFKVTLEDSKPSIWRRIQVPESFAFIDLHDAIQHAMGWTNSHLHGFEVPNPNTGSTDLIANDDPDLELDCLSEIETLIASYFSISNPKAIYEYDFGDSWTHNILLEKILPLEPGLKYPRCIAGKRACPPEDCGGIWGYEELLEKLKDPHNEANQEDLDWIGEDFDPENFDPHSVEF